MCDATRLSVLAELFPPSPYLSPPPCDACPWPLGHVVCFSPTTGVFVLCRRCADNLERQTTLAVALHAALTRPVRLI